jgi:glyoxylase-like metal-dependent hydrolase (beta-lactamase superfamily II)
MLKRSASIAVPYGAVMGDRAGPYRVYAVKYAERDARRPEHFLGGDPHDVPMPMDYFVWAVVGDDSTWVVDTGFGDDDAQRRQRRLLRSAAAALATIGVDAGAVADVILTHLHYDHAGGIEHFPNARFHVQDREMAYATGRHMTRPVLGHAFTADHVAGLVHAVHAGRVVFHAGDDEVAPGLSVHLIGGHTDGLQVVRVRAESGWIVLASDATHYYENMEAGRPFPTVFDVGAMIEGWDTLRRLAAPAGAVVPGHDPLVLQRYPAAGPGLEGVAVRLA